MSLRHLALFSCLAALFVSRSVLFVICQRHHGLFGQFAIHFAARPILVPQNLPLMPNMGLTQLFSGCYDFILSAVMQNFA